ncbi:MAG: YggS family pyridoxal phosphate-dependent enzyme [Clostridia bacterium]|nr:YggS family pyridoxal phosphate-dependent enzyme [Clostridia bacterium]
MSIRENIERINSEIGEACARSGRKTEEVSLIAVCKYVDEQRISEAFECGLKKVGENRAQELSEKLIFYKQNVCDIHFIGQLQGNKIKYVCGNADCIQSVDRLSLAEAIDRFAQKLGIRQDVLIQVNIGREEQKGGVDGEELDGFLSRASEFRFLRICGLMCVPPALYGESVRPYFQRMRELFERMKAAHPGLPLTELSMGMSHDYPVAIEEGATMVRVGTAIFGARR